MSSRFKVLAALAALVLGCWVAAYMLINSRNLSPAVEGVVEKLPGMPTEPQGRIDYHTLDRELAALTQRPEMAGLAVAVVEDGKISFVRAYGTIDKSTGQPVTPETVFRWASVSKTVTGLLAAKLADEGAVNIERPIASWRTSLRLPQGAEMRLTLAQLLSHQTGLTKNAYDEKLEADEDPRLAYAPLRCQPGTCHSYQNVAFDAASEILGQAAGRAFTDAVSEQFFHPLGMLNASYGMAGLTGAKDWARPHHLQLVRPVKEAYWRVPAAAGVNSNIGDFAKWMQAVMGSRPDILSPAALRLAETPLIATPRIYSGDLAKALSAPGYGLGMRSFTYRGHHLVGHSGAVAGYRATMIFEPSSRTGVVAMWNSNWGMPFRIPFAALDSYYRLPDCGWLDISVLPMPDDPPPPKTASTEESRPCLTP
jgi:beta-lactamase class C